MLLMAGVLRYLPSLFAGLSMQQALIQSGCIRDESENITSKLQG